MLKLELQIVTNKITIDKTFFNLDINFVGTV